MLVMILWYVVQRLFVVLAFSSVTNHSYNEDCNHRYHWPCWIVIQCFDTAERKGYTGGVLQQL